MPVLTTTTCRARWTQKPPPGARVDPGHPLARGLIGCWLLNERGPSLRNLGTERSGLAATFSGSPAWAGSPSGPALDFVAGDSDEVVLSGDTADFAIGSGSFSYGVMWRSSSINQFALTSRSSTTTAGYDFLVGAASIAGNIRVRAEDGTAAIAAPDTAGTNDGEYHFGWGVFTAGSPDSMQIIIDGVSGGSNTSTLGSIANSQSLRIGNRGGTFYTGQVALVLLYRRAISLTEARWLYAEPYAFVRAPTPRVRVFLPAAAEATATWAAFTTMSRQRRSWSM